ncbi:tRNA (5-methylaminomethyl-2-thiouridine)(34)-methyltransferase MnmD [Roseovarius sp. SCSIO 43702]|uniref:tRNA (5-methylaminomethyl-2-thiouridine)(34)-methyltransferase MnmD n=1 Tax=Roseovarius sp. SCSIO 43702 TaxID=2823043 RepID=UPI001C739065|nr:tRNA (5-methylaminomethyl-2-thiouridine)(34)-methyltransferase MnmD [Roseovarius sp. SCSIO 43702]QYX56158.1 tRNA (5-methylaminomethyl-2-thiouridine)(34)-methyltransferase MnmD [Roseovarius sp. SCSIO 43702]
MRGQTAGLEWRDGGVPVSTRFDDPYFSLENGLAETRHVFLAGNGLPGRLGEGFRVAELGFGTGLNALTLALDCAAMGGGCAVHMTSFEAYPMAAEDMARALAAFPEVAGIADALTGPWREGRRELVLPGNLHLRVIEGDARETLPAWDGMADAWFLDGFSPAKNPELWDADLLAEVGRHTAPDGTVATYTAAGFVRRNLAEAGFDVARVPGYGRKRHMTTARKVAR